MPIEPTPSEGAGPLSVDDAAQLIGPPPPEEDEVPAAEETETVTDLPAEPTAEDDEAAPEPAEEPVIEAPHSWGAEDKALFAQLPREVQEVILSRETQRDRAVFEAFERAAAASREAEAGLAGLAEVRSAVELAVASAGQAFAGRWRNVDWVKAASEMSSEDYNRARALYERDLSEMQRLSAAQQLAEEEAFGAFVKAEEAKLPIYDPELADPEQGMARRGEVMSYLVGAYGYAPEVLNRQVGAAELAIARKAMLYDQLAAHMDARARQPAQRPNPAPARPALRPAAAQARTSNQRSLEASEARLAKSGSVEDAIAVLQARRKAG